MTDSFSPIIEKSDEPSDSNMTLKPPLEKKDKKDEDCCCDNCEGLDSCCNACFFCSIFLMISGNR